MLPAELPWPSLHFVLHYLVLSKQNSAKYLPRPDMSSTRSKLTIDLNAIAHNWHLHAELVGPARCSAVVKADAYGLGMAEVSLRLYKEGCRDFFVASLHEALELQPLIAGDATIYILAGVFPGEELICLAHGFVPVLVSYEMLQRWQSVVADKSPRCLLKVDTGMGRLGLSEAELRSLLATGELERAGLVGILSHLACADDAKADLNTEQLERLKSIKAELGAYYPSLSYSLANSAGCGLGEPFYFDMVRPGIGLYGSHIRGPLEDKLKAVVSLSLEVIQVKTVLAGASVGYGATSVSDSDRLIAVAAGGYADGIFRYLSNKGRGFVSGRPVTIAGAVSMDSTIFDVTAVSEYFADDVLPKIELLGVNQSIDQLARDAGTIAYEILTSMGERFERVYIGSARGSER